MKRIILGLSVSFLFLIITVSGVSARRSPVNPHVSIPESAKKISNNVYKLGNSTDSNGRNVEGFAIVRYDKNFAKPPWAGGGDKGGSGDTGTSSCYEFLAKDAKWKSEENWIINTANIRGLESGYLLDNMSLNIDKWEEAATDTSILGEGSATSAALLADLDSPDDLNEVYFADIEEPGVIGVTIVWGIFGGPPRGRELVEWDQVYDDTDFDWSNNGTAGAMDFESIATHELGHTFGMGDLYDSNCSDMTMYGYASVEETSKRDLEDGDINGISTLY